LLTAFYGTGQFEGEIGAMITETVSLALIAGVIGLVSPMAMSWLTNRNRHQEKMEDYARQDAVAAQAAKAAALLAGKQDEIAGATREAARLLVANNERQALASADIGEKLQVIHTLVNSNMTAAMQAEHDATGRELAMMREVIDLKKLSGHEPTANALSAIAKTEGRLDELAAALKDRLKASDMAEMQRTAAAKAGEH
jgi:hypothetical protein